MITKAIWDYCIAADLINAADPRKTMNNLLDAIIYAKDDGTEINYCDELYYQNINNISFYSWLYDNNEFPEFADIKRELSKYLSKGQRITEDEYKEISTVVKNKELKDALIISFHISKENILYVFDVQRYLEAKQWYLSEFVSRDRFVDEAIGCFPNLVFHDSVWSSISTLNTDFKTIRPLIVKHLCALNNYQQLPIVTGSGVSFRKIAEEIQELYSIECSTQSGRASVQDLYYSFKDDETGATERVCCELHTKLKWKDMDKEHQDRIYFHPGKEDIYNKKILIAHIGTHK